MGITLTGKRVQNTYDSLLKLSSNDNLTSTPQLVGDGLGNDSPIYLSETKVGIGVSPSFQFQTSDAAKIGGNLTVGGNLIVEGSTTQVDSTIVEIGDNMIELAKDNIANIKDIGWYGTIVESGTKYVGTYYDASSGITTPTFYIGLGTTEPSNTASWTVKGKIVIGQIDSTGGTFSGQITIPETPTADGHAASKKYVDDQIGGVDKARRVTIQVKNTETISLSKGTVVHAEPTATPPSGNIVEVKKADYDTASLMPAIAILNEDLDAAGGTNDEGEAIMFGFINGINTSSFSAGDELYVGNDGSLTNSKPLLTTQLIQKIAVVMKVDASNGSIEVFGAGRSNDVPNEVDRDLSIAGTLKVDDEIQVEADSGYGRLEVGGPDGGYIDLKTPFSDDYDLRIITNSSGSEFTGSGDFNINAGNTLTLTLDGTTQDATFAGDVTVNGGDVTAQRFNNSTGNVLDTDGTDNYIKGGSAGSNTLYGQYSSFRSIGHIYPNTDSTYNLGSTSLRWANVWTDNINGGTPVNTANDLVFDRATTRKIIFNSDTNFGSDSAFLYFNENSSFHRTGTENVRFSIGAFNDFSNSTTHSDAVDIQGGARLYLNAGDWDTELDSAIGTPSTGAYLDSYPIQFAVNNDVKVKIGDSGFFTVISGNIVLEGTGRIQGIDSITANTDAVNKLYVDNAVSGLVDGSGTANDVVMWSDSDTLTDAPIAISGNNATFAGNVVITGSGSANSASLQIDNPDSNSFNHSIEAFAANLTSGESNVLLVGKEGGTRNAGYIGYNWASSGSVDNYITFGHWGVDHIMKIYGDGDIHLNSYAYAVANVNSTGDSGLNLFGNRLGFDESGTRNWTIKAASGQLNFYSGDNNGAAYFFQPTFAVSSSSAQNLDVVLSNTRGNTADRVRIQTTAGGVQWDLENDQNLDTFKIRYSTGAADVLKLTNGSPENSIVTTSTGVGIGTDSPTAKLDVQSSGSWGTYGRGSSGDINVENTNTSVTEGGWIGIAGYMGNTANGGYYHMAGITAKKSTTAGDGNYGGDLSFWTTAGSGQSGEANSGMYQRMTINRFGHVGIGSDLPSKPLHIQTNDSAYGSMRIYRDSTTQGEVSIGFFAKSNQPTNQAWVIGEGGWIGGGKFVIGNENGGAGGNVRLVIEKAGNIGINQSNPSTTLHIGDGSDSDRGIVTIEGAGGNHLIFSETSTHSPGANAFAIRPASGTKFIIQEDGSTSAAVVVDTSGNVGINETNPSSSISSSSTVLQISDSNVASLALNQSSVGKYEIAASGLGLDIRRNGTNHLTIDSSGATSFAGSASVSTAVASIQHLSSNGYLYIKGGSGGLIIGDDSTSSRIQIEDNSNIRFETAGTERMRIDSSGNVGIGRTGPSEKMDIQGNVKIFPEGSSWAEGLSFSMPTQSVWGGLRWRRERSNSDGNHYIGFVGNYANDDLVFGSNNGGSQVDYSLAINKDGRVTFGGTTFDTAGQVTMNSTKQYALVINHNQNNSAADFEDALFIKNINNNNSNYVSLGMSTNGTDGQHHRVQIRAYKGGSNYEGQLRFFMRQTNASNVEKYRFYANGEFHADSDIVAFSTTISDKRLKDKVVTIDSALDKVKSLRGVEYVWNNGSKKGKKDLGVIAQEVEEILPEIVTEKEMAFFGEEKYKTVDYEKLTAVLIESVKELSAKVEALENKKCNCNCK